MDEIPVRRWIGVTLLAWLAVIGFDFLLHASILAPLYADPHPFLLPPERAFVLIPLGYLSFLVYVVALVWMVARLSIHKWKDGLLFGLKFGALVWGSLALGLLSVSSVAPKLMLGWFIGQTIESGIAGLVIGAGLGAEKLGKLTIAVLVFAIGLVILGILLQNL